MAGAATAGGAAGGPRALLAAAALAGLLAGCQGIDPTPEAAPPTPAQSARGAERALQDARAFLARDRAEAAERAADRGLALAPDHAGLLRARARARAAQGRDDEAARDRARADRLDPPPPPPPDTPLPGDSKGVLVALLPPDAEGAGSARRPEGWPDSPSADWLRERLALRLPDARVVLASPDTISTARSLLSETAPRAVVSLRLERLFCGDTRKDGRFGLAWLRVGAERRGGPPARPRVVRAVLAPPPAPETCRRDALAHALEAALAEPAVALALGRPAPPAQTAYSNPALRHLFPGIEQRLEAELRAGERWLAMGELAEAEAAFRRAARVDPDDRTARTYLLEMERSLALARELAAAGEDEPERIAGAQSRVDPRLPAARRRELEAQLAAERRRRRDLLAALEVLAEDLHAPSPQTVDSLRPVRSESDGAFGPARARERAGGPVEARAAYAPDGSVLARYYLPAGGERPVLREEDTDGDGSPDRWIAYAGGSRAEIWEDGRGRGRPDVHLVFAPGGAPLERIELDVDTDGRPERLFRYESGELAAESRDTDRDGVFDRFDRLDPQGRVTLREEDLDGDGRIDVRSLYDEGRLERREILSPELFSEGGAPVTRE